jgi:hypothetical protein
MYSFLAYVNCFAEEDPLKFSIKQLHSFNPALLQERPLLALFVCFFGCAFADQQSSVNRVAFWA